MRIMAEDITEHLQYSARGGLILMIGNISSTFISALATIIIARFLGSLDYGELTVAVIPISIASIFTDLGINNGLIKFISQYRSEKREQDIYILLKAGLLINIGIGVVLFFILFTFSGFFASYLLHDLEYKLLIQVGSINLLTQSLISTSKSIFIGFEKMKYVSILEIVQSITRSILAPLLVYLGLGPLGGVIGQTTSLIIAGLVGIIFIFLLIKNGVEHIPLISYFRTSRMLLVYGFPLFLSNIISGVVFQFNNVLMASHIDTYVIGNYRAAATFSVIINFISVPISTVLFPLFSKFSRHENRVLKVIYQNSVKYYALIIIPVTMVLMLTSDSLIGLLYGVDYPLTASYMKIYFLTFLYTGLGLNSISNLLNSKGDTKIIFITIILNMLIGLPTSFYLVTNFNIIGLLVAMILTPLPGLIYNHVWIQSNYGFSIDWIASGKIFFSSILSYLVVDFLISLVNVGLIITILLSGGLFFITYLSFLLLIKTITLADVHNLRRIVPSLGPFTYYFNLFLSFLEKFIPK